MHLKYVFFCCFFFKDKVPYSYSDLNSVLEYRTTPLLKMTKFRTKYPANCLKYKNCQLQQFRRIYLVYKNECLKILRPILRKLEIENLNS